MAVGMAMSGVIVVMMAMPAEGFIGAGFGRERAVQFRHCRADAAQHVDQHMVVADAHPAIGQHLDRRVSVAGMPGDARGLRRGIAAGIGDRFIGGAHGDDTTALDPQPVAIIQPRRIGEVEQEGLAGIVAQPDTATVAVVEIQRHRRHRIVLRPVARRQFFDRPPHAQNRK